MPAHKSGTLFLTLRVFSATGGIEKVCRVAGKALNELSEELDGQKVKIFSLYDNTADVNDKYFPTAIFAGFDKHRTNFLRAALNKGIGCHTIILSHVNLLIVGFIIRILSPKTKLILLAHGIEVWRNFPAWKKKMLHKCDQILPVSDFTKKKMMQLYQLPEEKFTVLNNCLDPFLPSPLQSQKDNNLLARYGILGNDQVLLSLTRMAFKDRYKGYDQVIQAVHQLKESYPLIKYLVVGKYDAMEKKRLDIVINGLCLADHIILAGFIPEEELAAHYNLADLFIMPSQKEGFGIVFIEAMFYGKPVIAGNMDGSTDALKNGHFGLLVNPASQQQITNAIIEVLGNKQKYIPEHAEVMEYFGYEVYKKKLKGILAKAG